MKRKVTMIGFFNEEGEINDELSKSEYDIEDFDLIMEKMKKEGKMK